MEIVDKFYLEFKSGLKVRRGFDKFIDKALCFFNFNKIEEKEAILVINFINQSNSKLSNSYWVLRKGMTLKESEKERRVFCKNFVESSYKKTNRANVSKKFIGVNKSRGYSGWVEVSGKKFYCRSQFEFVFIHHLSEIYKDCIIEYEHSIFRISPQKSYKPDFFIFKDNILIKVIEVKSSGVFLETKEYEEIYKYFKKNKIEYEVLFDISLILKQNSSIKERLKEWKESSFIERDMRGKNNPSYGVKCSEGRKEKIRKKAKERSESLIYRKNIGNSLRLINVLKFLKDKNEKYNTVYDNEGGIFYYILKDDGSFLFPLSKNRVENIKKMLKNENKLN